MPTISCLSTIRSALTSLTLPRLLNRRFSENSAVDRALSAVENRLMTARSRLETAQNEATNKLINSFTEEQRISYQNLDLQARVERFIVDYTASLNKYSETVRSLRAVAESRRQDPAHPEHIASFRQAVNNCLVAEHELLCYEQVMNVRLPNHFFDIFTHEVQSFDLPGMRAELNRARGDVRVATRSELMAYLREVKYDLAMGCSLVLVMCAVATLYIWQLENSNDDLKAELRRTSSRSDRLQRDYDRLESRYFAAKKSALAPMTVGQHVDGVISVAESIKSVYSRLM